MVPMPLPISGSSKETDTVTDELTSSLNSPASSVDNESSAVKAVDRSSSVEPIALHPPASNSNDTCHQGCNGNKQFENKPSEVSADDCCKETEPEKRKPLKYKLPRNYKVPSSVHKLSHFDHASLTGLASKPRTKSAMHNFCSRKPDEYSIEKRNDTSFRKAYSQTDDANAHHSLEFQRTGSQVQPQLPLNRSRPGFQDTVIASGVGRSSNVPVMRQRPTLAAQSSLCSSLSNGNGIVSKENQRCNDQEQGGHGQGQEPNPGPSSDSEFPNQQCRSYAPLNYPSNGNGVVFKNNYGYQDHGQGGSWQEPNHAPSSDIQFMSKQGLDSLSSQSNGNGIVSKENHRCHDREQGEHGREPSPGPSSDSQFPNERSYPSNGNGVVFEDNYRHQDHGQGGSGQEPSRGPSSDDQFMNKQQPAYSPQGSVSYQSNGNGFAFKDNYRYHYQGQGGLGQELNRGPRFLALSKPSTRRENLEKVSQTIKVDNYNLPDFQTEYKDARFYIIKSFGEVDVQKSIKYHVWSSTHCGNNKLDAAFREAAEQKCPVFLFFSVNGSGQFLGVAEMVGRVDFKKTMQFWMDDLWEGFFPVKWHIIKDVPHRFFRHIILKNNDNRCVTFTRDTQEVGLEQGLEMLNIFKNFSEQTSLLDDFCYYEELESSRRSRANPRKPSRVDGSGNDNHGCRVRSLHRF